MEFSPKGLGARTFLIAASIGLAACSSISDETLDGAAAEDHLEVTTTTSAEPVITVAPTVQTTDRGAGAADAEVDDAEVAAAPTTTAPAPTTEAPTTQAPSTTVEAAMVAVDTVDDEESAAAAQLQDDDEEELESLPNTGPNETMLVIAIGCAFIVGGRTLIDLVNQAARAIQRMPVRTRSAPPR